jgi:hypothetical protein
MYEGAFEGAVDGTIVEAGTVKVGVDDRVSV